MLPHEAAALDVIRATWPCPVLYTGAGLDAQPVSSIKSDTAGQPFQGFEGRPREVSFEIAQALLPGEPDKHNLIEELTGERWEVIDITDRDDIGAWVFIVEEAPPA